MKKIEKQIPQEISNYLEGLSYELNARKDLCAYMIDRGMNGTEQFKKYHKEYMEFYAQYQIAKNDMEVRFIKREYPNCKWNLDFSTSIVTIEVSDGESNN